MVQKELAAVLRVDPSTLARSERDERVPAGKFLYRVREVLGEVVAEPTSVIDLTSAGGHRRGPIDWLFSSQTPFVARSASIAADRAALLE
jgi:transcriptional regulator with XRE-family HTH domain